MSDKDLHQATMETTPVKTTSSVEEVTDADLSPLKQLQRMNANGTLTIGRSGTGRRRKSSSILLDCKGEDLRQVNSLNDMSKCGNESPDLQKNKSLTKSEQPLDVSSLSMVSTGRCTSPNNNSLITGEGDVRGASESLVPPDPNGNVGIDAKQTVEVAQKDIINPEVQHLAVPGGNAVVVEDKNANMTFSTHTLEKRRSNTVAPIILPGAEFDEKVKQEDILKDHESSPAKVTEMNVLNITYTSIPKPIIEVKLVKNDRSGPPTPRSRHATPRSTPRSTPPRVVYPRDTPDQSLTNISKSVDDLDISQSKPKDIIYSSTNLMGDVKYRHSFIDRNRDSMYSSIGEMNTVLKTEAPDEEKVYSLPQPQCYSDNTLKAVKQITEKYDTLQRRKMRAMSFRENSKFSPIEPGSPITQAALWNLKVEPVTIDPRPDTSREIKSKKKEHTKPDCVVVDTFDDVVCVASGITRRDISRIDLFYRGRETEVVVCSCLVDMRMGMPGGDGVVSTWEHLCTGVPVFVLNTGLCVRRRELNIILAERETGFPLWQDKITYLTNYKEVSPVLHCMHVSNQLRKMVGLTFYCEGAASEFITRFRKITADPNDDLWKVSTGKGDKKKKVKKSKKFKRPNKKDISQPCNFTHITRVDPSDRTLYDSFQNLGITGSPARKEYARPRLQTA